MKAILFAALAILAPTAFVGEEPNELEAYVLSFGPTVLSHAELLALSDGDRDPSILARLDEIFITPFVNNEAYHSDRQPLRPTLGELGPGLRLVVWNVRKGVRLDAILEAILNPEAFVERVLEAADTGEEDGASKLEDLQRTLESELDVLRSADVWVLNEADWGLGRTCFRNVTSELAAALGMNWAFGVEFVEIDPETIGGEESACRPFLGGPSAETAGLHGTAVLSRYPILDARLEPFETQGYDWDADERGAKSPLEHGRRITAQVVFKETIRREIRMGGRTTLLVTLEVPGLEESRLTVAAPHLEGRAESGTRRAQMAELLELIRDVRHPVVLAGDLNTSLDGQVPTSFGREAMNRVGNPRFWAATGIKFLTGLGFVYDVATRGAAWLINQDDPTSAGFPVIAPNPEGGLFEDLESFRFDDGRAFDFRGDASRTLNGTTGTLGNSNARDTMGFVTTYELERSIGPIGKYKLDWILVKGYLADPRDVEGSYRFAPHFPRALGEVNRAVPGRISDHVPISVDLPFGEPGP